MKLCIDCAHYSESGRCKVGNPLYKSPITGYMTRPVVADWRGDPELQRHAGFIESLILRTCGRRARWFKPKSLN